MGYRYSLTVIDDDGNIIVDQDLSPDAAVKVLADALVAQRVIPREVASEPTIRPARLSKKKSGRKPGGHNPLDSDLANEAARRHPMTGEIERLLIEGMPVAEIAEQCDASKPTVYVIKTRLKNEGRLVEA